jgi:PAS domain S-box-containing protein
MTEAPVQILHVDDDPGLAELAATYLERENDQFSVEIATSAAEGLAIVEDDPPDCLVSDYDMPRLNGIELLQNVRDQYPELPVILFTGKGSEEVASDAISAGVTDYLQKESGTEQYEILANRIANAVEQYRAKHRVQTERQRFQALFDRLSQPTVEVEYEGTDPVVQRVNPAFEDVFGYSAGAITGESLDEYIVPDARQDEAADINQHVQTGGRLESREVVRQTDEGPREFLLQNAVYDDGSGGFAIYTDITTRNERKNELERSQELLRHTEQLAGVGGWAADVDTGDVRWTQGTYAIHGVDPNGEFEPTLETAIGFYHPDDQATIETAVANCYEHGEPYEVELRLDTAEGNEKWVRTRGEPVYGDDEITAVRGAIQDVTPHKQRESQLQQFEQIVTYSPEFLVVMNEDMTVEFQSPPSPLLEWDPLNVAGETPLEHVHPDDREKLVRHYAEVKQHPDQISTAEFRAQDADGEWRWVETRVQNFLDDDGIGGILAAIRDITPRKQQEQQLGQYSTYFEQLQATTQALLRSTEVESAAEHILESFENVFEFDIAGIWLSTDDEQTLEPVAVSERGQELIPEPPTYSSSTQSLSWDAYQAQELKYTSDVAAHDQRYNEATPIGSEVIVPIGRHGLLTIGATGPDAFTEREIEFIELWCDTLTAIVDRITQLNLLQEREAELERERNRLDEFTTVVSHDLRNPLNVAVGRAELAATECDSDHLLDATQALTRMEELVDDLLTLARQGSVIGETTAVELEDIASQCWQNIDARSATLRVVETATVQADGDRLSQVFENLFRNAVEHGEDSVTITVGRTGDGFYVADDGPGISKESRSQIFERGFTESDEGTGLGLAIVRRICEAHGWETDVKTSESGGARFEFTGAGIGTE